MRRRGPDEWNLATEWEALRADYDMAKSSRFRRSRSGVGSVGQGADYHLRSESDYLRMVELAWDLIRNNPVIGQIVERAVTNTLQDGMTPDPQTGDPGLDAELKARDLDYREDADKSDLAGEMTYPEMIHVALFETLAAGDVLLLPTRDGPLQMVEGHRLRTPRNTSRNVVLGVLLGEYRKREAYWVAKDDVGLRASVKLVSDVVQYPTRDEDGNRQVFHLYNPRRVSQTRGVTALAPISGMAEYFDDIMFARLIQQQVISCFAIFHQREIEFGTSTPAATGAQSTQMLADGSTRTIEGPHPGMRIYGEPGEKLEGFSTNVPNPEFFPFMRLILQLIGVNLGLPLTVVLLDSSETNFSGWRGAMDQAKLGFRWNQQWVISRLLRPDYLRRVRMWMADDPAMRGTAGRGGVNIFAHHWNRPRWPYIEPFTDAKADLLRLRNAQVSHRRWAQESGYDWDDLSTEIVDDNAQLIEKAYQKAEALKKTYPGLDVTWRELASLPLAEGFKMNLGDQGTEQDAKNTPTRQSARV